MVIRKMTAVFGCLDGAQLELHEGVERLVLPNEGGKSTWAAFIAAMFYGLENTRAAKGRLSGRERYVPWSGRAMEGTMELELSGRQIVLQRSSENGKPFGVFRAWDKQTGLTIDTLNGENCGKILLGVEREVFCRTAFLAGGDLTVTKDADLTRRLEQLAGAGRETDSFLAADSRLRTWQNRLRYHSTGLIPKAQQSLQAMQEAQAELLPATEGLPDSKTLLRMLGRLEMMHDLPPAPPALQDTAEAEMLCKAQKDLNRQKCRAGIGFALCLLMAVLGVTVTPWLLLAALWAAVAGAAVLFDKKLPRAYGAERLRDILPAAAACQEGEKFRREQALLLEAVSAFAPAADTPEAAKAAVTEALTRQQRAEALAARQPKAGEEAALRAELLDLEQKEQAVILARQALAQANAVLQSTYVPKLTSLAGEYLQALTMGRYEALVMDEDLTLSVKERNGLLRPIAALSSGTKDQTWLAVRIAMTELLLPQGAPIILDDALLTFDRTRERAALELLANQDRQVLCFSCR